MACSIAKIILNAAFVWQGASQQCTGSTCDASMMMQTPGDHAVLTSREDELCAIALDRSSASGLDVDEHAWKLLYHQAVDADTDRDGKLDLVECTTYIRNFPKAVDRTEFFVGPAATALLSRSSRLAQGSRTHEATVQSKDVSAKNPTAAPTTVATTAATTLPPQDANCPAWVGTGQYGHGTCAIGTTHHGACYDGAKVKTTQCLGAASYPTYICPPESPIKCIFSGATTTPPSDGDSDTCPAWVGTEHGLCNMDTLYGACYNSGKATNSQCLYTKEQYDPYTCPPDAPSKCTVGKAQSDACPAWVGTEHGLCDMATLYGACYNSGKTTNSQCLYTKEKYDPYTCPPDAPSKCKV